MTTDPPGDPQHGVQEERSAPSRPLSGLSLDDLITLNEEIAGMARAGLPLDQGLAELARDMGRGRLRRVTEAIAADLHAGRTLPEALDRQSGRVPPFYAGLIAAGVRTGRISEVLATLTLYARSLADLRNTVISALFYPGVVLVLSFGLFAFISQLILPQHEKNLRDFGMKLPVISEVMLVLGRHVFEYVILPVLLAVALLLLLYLGLRFSSGGRQLWARLVYSLPLVGTLIRSARLAAFADLLGILIDHELPLPEAFRLAGGASSDPITAGAARQVEDGLREGLPLAEVLRGRGLMPELVVWMVSLGEQRGTLGPTLHQVAELYRRQVEMRAALLRSVLPPFLIIATGGVMVVLFVLATMLPMFKLLEGLSK